MIPYLIKQMISDFILKKNQFINVFLIKRIIFHLLQILKREKERKKKNKQLKTT